MVRWIVAAGVVLASLGAWPPPSSLAAEIPAGLVSWWKGDGNTSDSSGPNNGVAEGGLVYAAGMGGQAFSFNGVDAAVRLPTHDIPTYLDAFTISAWLSTTALGERYAYFSGDSSQPAGSIISLGVLNGYLMSTNGGDALSGGYIADGGLHHVAATFDGATFRLYVDGAFAISGVMPYVPSARPDVAYIGRSWLQCAGDSQGCHWDGLVDELQVYSRALSDAEIRDLAVIQPPTVDDLVPGGYVDGGALTIHGHTVPGGHIVCHHSDGGDVWETDAGADGTWSLTIDLGQDGGDSLYIEDTSVGRGTPHRYAGGSGGLPVHVDGGGGGLDFHITGSGGVGGWYLNDVGGGINAIDSTLLSGAIDHYEIYWSVAGDETIAWTAADGGPCGCLPDGALRFHNLGQRTLSYYIVDQYGHRGPTRHRLIRNKAPLSLTAVTVSPGVFSTAVQTIQPGGGLTSIGYSLSEAGTVQVRIVDGSGTVLRTVRSGARRDAGVWAGDTWDALDDRGALVANCGCRVLVDGVDLTGNAAVGGSGRLVIDSLPPSISVGVVTAGGTFAPGVAPFVRVEDLDPSGAVDGASGVDPSRTQILLDGQPFVSGTAVVGDGAHVLTVNAADLAGNAVHETIPFGIVSLPDGGVKGLGDGPSPGATPELGSLVLFASGAAGLAGYVRLRLAHRKRRKS